MDNAVVIGLDKVDDRKGVTNKIRTTKYTLLTCLPLFLFFFFSKVSNIFFTVASILVLLPGIAPLSPLSFILPFSLIILITVAKEIAEDLVTSI